MRKQKEKTANAATTSAEDGGWDMPERTYRLCLLVLAVLVAGLYARTLHFEYVDWDDYAYVLENKELGPLSVSQVRTEFGRFVMGNYHPVTMLSYSVEILFAGKHAGLMHATNALLHVVNALLVAALVLRLSGKRLVALCTVALWALHPMRVESVAWISARKDLLMLLFGLLMLLSYLRWLRTHHIKWLLAAHVAFVLACLSKAMAVAFVPTLFLLDLWVAPKSGIWSWFKDKLFFVALALVCGAVAVKAQADLGVIANVPLAARDRAFTGAANLVIYVAQQLVPVNLSAFYSYPLEDGAMPNYYILLGLIGAVFIVLTVRGAWRRQVLWLAAAFMIINLLLVLQWLPVGQAVRADRYTYAAGIGHALMVVVCLSGLVSRSTRPWAVLLIASAVVLLCTSAPTLARIGAWSDSVAVRSDMIDGAPRNFVFYMDRSISWERAQLLDEALADLNTAVRLRPANDYKPYFVRGGFLTKHGRHREAMADFLKVFRQVPDHPGLLPNMLYAQRKLGLCNEVEKNATAALRLDPEAIDILNLRALCRNAAGSTDSAWADVRRSLHVAPLNDQTLLIGAAVRAAARDTATACWLMDRLTGSLLVDDELDSLHTAMVRSCSEFRSRVR